jgi:hypothetical protein
MVDCDPNQGRSEVEPAGEAAIGRKNTEWLRHYFSRVRTPSWAARCHLWMGNSQVSRANDGADRMAGTWCVACSGYLLKSGLRLILWAHFRTGRCKRTSGKVSPSRPGPKEEGGVNMFHDFVKSKLEAGEIKVRSSDRQGNGQIDIEASGIAAIAVWFLSRKEKEELAQLSKYVAMRSYRVSVDEPDY